MFAKTSNSRVYFNSMDIALYVNEQYKQYLTFSVVLIGNYLMENFLLKEFI